MAKYESIRALAKKQLQAVTESSDRWKAFLRTAAIAYNYSFPNQLLIHEQSPTATAVADIAYWNNNAGRWVKRGAHGIAVFDTRANSSRLRYLFDISDTIPRAEVPDALPWVITDQNWRPVWDKIVADNHADSIQSALLMLSTSCVAQRSAMFTTALGKAIDGSSLQWAKPDEQRQLFLQLITQSCLYMAALRCGVDTARLDLSALESVNQFDTNRITLCLGSACQQAARPLMQQIGSITREIDSVARAEKVRYYGDVYDDMKAKLIERGIPETEIAFIHEANTDARKTELFGKVRSGAVRVLMGSTAKMGAGTNVQQRLVALHHLDVPWRPSDIEQREGRILRQGNENKEVYVFRYVTEGTFDAYSWQLIENKQKFIGQIMTSKSPARSCDDMDEAALSYAEVKALAAGNPLIKEKMDLDVQLTRLKTLKAAHDSQRYELENKIAIGFPAEIRKCKEQIENATVDAATVKEHSAVDADGKDVFCIQLEKKVYYEKEPAGKALLGLLGLALNSEKPVPIGYFKGMELQIQHLSFGNEYHARLVGSGTYSTQLGADVLGNLTRLSNLANGIEPSIEKTRNMQIQLEQQLASAEEEVKRPFPQATELTEKSKRLAVLEGLLNMNDKDIVTDTEPEQQCQTDNRQRGQEER